MQNSSVNLILHNFAFAVQRSEDSVLDEVFSQRKAGWQVAGQKTAEGETELPFSYAIYKFSQLNDP
jgi:hypothetical protein